MQEVNITDMIALFDQQSEQVKNYLTDLLEVIKDGGVPSTKAIASLNEDVTVLNARYDAIYALVKEVLPKEEFPAHGSNVSELMNAIKESRSKLIEEQLIRAKSILMRFMSIKSMTDEYMMVLIPYQKEAASLLSRIAEYTMEELLAKTESAELFLQIIDTENIHSSEGINLMKGLQQHFPEAEIQFALSGNQYFYEISEKVNETHSESGCVELVADPLALETHQPMLFGASSEKDSLANHLSILKGPIVIEMPTEAEKLNIKYIAVNKVKIAVPSANAFKKEIIKMAKNNRKIKTILPLFTLFGVLTRSQIYMFGICMNCFDRDEEVMTNVYSAVDMLTVKGYLACFSANKLEDRYCLSNYCSGSMHKESITQQMKMFWSISYGFIKVMANTELDKSVADRYIMANSALLLYLLTQKNHLPEKEYAKIIQSIKWNEDHYRVTVVDNGEVKSAYLAVSDTDLASLNEEYIIISKECYTITKNFNDSCVRVFVVEDERVYTCDPRENIQVQIDMVSKLEEINDLTDDEDLLEVTAIPTVSAKSVAVPSKTLLNTKKGLITTVEEEKEKIKHTPEVQQTGVVMEKPTTTEQVFNELKADSSCINHSNVSAQTLLELNRIPSDEEFNSVIHSILTESVPDEKMLTTAIVQAVLLAKGAGLERNRPLSKQLSFQLSLATNLLLDECIYSSEFLATAFVGMEKDIPALALAAYMYAMLDPGVTFDYGLKAQAETYFSNYDLYFEELLPFKTLFNKLMGIRDVIASGFTPAVISLLGNEAESERFINNLTIQAKSYLTLNIPRARIKALPIMYGAEFGVGSCLYMALEMIVSGKTDTSSLEWIETVLAEYCDNTNGLFSINEELLEQKLNKAWEDATQKSKFKLEFDARAQVIRQYRLRLNVMLAWVEHFRTRTSNQTGLARLRKIKKDILNLIQAAKGDSSWYKVKDANVLAWMLQNISAYLNDEKHTLSIYADLLYTGVFSLAENGTPEIATSQAGIKYYELWRNALRHITATYRTLEELTSDILGASIDDDEGLKDNLRQLTMLGKHIGTGDDTFIVSEQQVKEAVASADIRTEQFKDDLELAYTYYQINENEKETLSGIMTQYKSDFYDIGDFACWRQFLGALEKQIHEFAEGRKKELKGRLNAKRIMDSDSTLLVEAERLLEMDSNFAVTEEYLNRYEAGERELDNITLFDNDYFSDFLTPTVFDPLLLECIRCKGRSLKSFGSYYLEKNFPGEWTSRLKENSINVISNWPVRKDSLTPMQVQGLFEGLGLLVIKTTKVIGKKEEMWQLTVNPTARSLADYLHPMAAFGTQIKSPMNAIFLYGNYTEQQLVDTVTSMNLGGISLVIIDRPIDAASRRNIGEIFHTQKSGQNPFLLIDQVLILYLAMHQETERLPALLKCTLPYTTYQPFVRDGGSTADEMFCGRTLELATVIDPNGACVVYGGRQLGKTALLERAESRCSKPENKTFAIYTTITRHKTEADVVETIVNDIKRKTNGKIDIQLCKTLHEMCAQLGDMFRSGHIVSMHLLIDEVDSFLEAIASDAYKPLQALVDLKRETKNNFKFVIAGLHNVCRAKNATRDNGIFGQLGTPLCIKPLSPTDALQLLSKPLRYLGFQIDRYPHLETILTNTNYYPGILQFFGYILVETLTGQYSKYYAARDGNPPFTLQDEQLGAVMNSSDLNKSIKDKFRWSLELDPRYFMIARCITMLYHFSEDDRASASWRGFTVENIMEMAKEYKIHCLNDVDKSEYIILLDEMVEMGILGKPDDEVNTYRLRRNSFVDIIGENIDVLEADIIYNNMED